MLKLLDTAKDDHPCPFLETLDWHENGHKQQKVNDS